MKKRLLFLAIATGIVSYSANAQISFPMETFNTGVLPTGWSLISDGNTVGAFASGVPGLDAGLDAAAWVPISNTYTGMGSGTDYQMITTSLFTPTGTANRWIITPSFSITAGSDSTVLQWDDNDLGSGEDIQVWVSPTAGTTAGSFTDEIYHAAAGAGNSLVTHQISLGAYAGTTITVAFRDNTTNNWGLLLDNVEALSINTLDLGVSSINLLPFGQVGTAYPITGVLQNYGATTTTGLRLNYSVNGGAPVQNTVTGLSVALGSTYNYSSATSWTPTAAGTYTIKVWADNINGSGVDENHTNDTAVTTVLIVNTLQPKRVLVEEFNQASCDPCAEATANLDTVYINNMSRSIMVRYHVDFPGRDCIDSVTLTPFVQTRMDYYSVSGVPDAQVDGQYVYPGAAGAGTFSTTVMDEFAAAGSPLTISVTPSYNYATQTYSFTATVKGFGDIPAGLKAYAALTIDTITYAANQSTETIPQTVFPEVAENMFPAGGTTLGAFTDGSTQTVTGTWAKNHPWGSDRSVWTYDSTCSGAIVVWVENDAETYVYQAGFAAVQTGKCTEGVTAVTSSNGSMDIYPNPANKNATIALNLINSSNVQLQVYNALGQLVYSMPAEYRNAGNSLTALDISNFASGDYIVKVTIGDQLLSKVLTVSK